MLFCFVNHLVAKIIVMKKGLIESDKEKLIAHL